MQSRAVSILFRNVSKVGMSSTRTKTKYVYEIDKPWAQRHVEKWIKKNQAHVKAMDVS
jgi:hypothetical protein